MYVPHAAARVLPNGARVKLAPCCARRALCSLFRAVCKVCILRYFKAGNSDCPVCHTELGGNPFTAVLCVIAAVLPRRPPAGTDSPCILWAVLCVAQWQQGIEAAGYRGQGTSVTALH